LFIFLNGVVEFPERWGFKYLSRDMSELIVAGIARADAVLLSPATYRFFERMWPHQADDVPMAKFLNHSPKYSLKNAEQRRQARLGAGHTAQGRAGLGDCKAEGGARWEYSSARQPKTGAVSASRKAAR
jgi:hypothetical protein